MSYSRASKMGGFTLVELMVSAGILSLLVLMLVTMTDQTSTIWKRTTGKAEQFREARSAFEAMTTRLAQATLNTYWAYDNPTTPKQYERRSELRFISGPASELFGAGATPERTTHGVFFQLPLGLSEKAKYEGFESLLGTCGYYLEYGDDKDLRPSFINESIVPVRYRYRLKELCQPAEENFIYKKTSGVGTARIKYSGKEWFQDIFNTTPPVHVIAENVIALIITPRLSKTDEEEVRKDSSNPSPDWSPLAPDYLFDSSPTSTGSDRYKDGRLNPIHQLPPLLQVTMVAIDELAAQRMDLGPSSADPFELHGKFKQSANYSEDLLESGSDHSLEALLIKKGLNYRIFSTNVVIRGAKWSREQTN